MAVAPDDRALTRLPTPSMQDEAAHFAQMLLALPPKLRDVFVLDAERDKADWRDVARIVLHRDPDLSPSLTYRCWERHLARARWMTVNGYKHLLAKADAASLK